MEKHTGRAMLYEVRSAMNQTRNGHTRPVAPVLDLNGPGRLRVAHLLALLGVSHSTLYSRIKGGHFPPPDGYDGSMPYWKTSTIRPLLDC
jgi:predicted DNA-binding transcriptional regulator AlpA